MKQYLTHDEQEISRIVFERAVAWGKEFMSVVLTSKDGINKDTTIESLLTQPDGSYDSLSRLEFLNNCEDKVFGSVSEVSLDHINTIGELIEKFHYMKFGPNAEDKAFLKAVDRMNGIRWTKIEAMPDHLRDGRDVILYYPLEGLSNTHPKVIIGYWNKKLKVWVWQNRAVRAYSDTYQPTHYAEINLPE